MKTELEHNLGGHLVSKCEHITALEVTLIRCRKLGLMRNENDLFCDPRMNKSVFTTDVLLLFVCVNETLSIVQQEKKDICQSKERCRMSKNGL